MKSAYPLGCFSRALLVLALVFGHSSSGSAQIPVRPPEPEGPSGAASVKKSGEVSGEAILPPSIQGVPPVGASPTLASDKKNGQPAGETVLPPPIQGVPPILSNQPPPPAPKEANEAPAEAQVTFDPLPPTGYSLGATIGATFEYPFWPTSNFTIPDPSGGKLPIGPIRDATRSFSASPIVEVDYTPPKPASSQYDSTPPAPAFGFGGSGYYISLTSVLQRGLTNSIGTETLDAKSSFNILVINAEGTATLGQHLTLGIGPRYTSINQDFTASVISKPNTSTFLSHEDFTGVGGTVSLKCVRKGSIAEALFSQLDSKVIIEWISLVRGSCLVGTNNRWSSVSIGSAASAATKVSEVATSFVPIGELYLGVHYKRPATGLIQKYRLYDREQTGDHPTVEFYAALTGQVWGGVGMPSASATSPTANNGSLYLVGFIVGTGFKF
jgi:hypothetical protein